MAPQFFVVSRDARHRYEDLKREFAGEPGIEVILDRRHGERRRVTERGGPDDRRRHGRRAADAVASGPLAAAG
jgi:hypothetical protein